MQAYLSLGTAFPSFTLAVIRQVGIKRLNKARLCATTDDQT